MPRNISIFVLALFFCVFTIAPLMAAEAMPPPEWEAFWTYITKTNPYQKWSFFPGYEGLYEGQSPHGAYLKVYVNDIALKAAKAKKTMPPGAIIVKENYGKDKNTLMAITPMYKVKGYNPDGGDWFWAKYGADGTVMKAGKVKSCINCHAAHKNKDLRFLHVKK